jgi:ABC-2 type transport system ATP-binding protein
VTGANAIEVKGLTKTYGSVKAVDGLDLGVPAGAVFGFIGPNGAGKSTTIGCMTGMLDPDAGSICLLGESLNADAVDVKRRIGVLPEGLGVFDYLYAHEFLEFEARMFGMDAAPAYARAQELLEALDLEEHRRKRIGELSTGLRKRVAFGAAVIHDPEILFLDEPFESVDAAAVAGLKQFLREFAGRGGTVFLTTHVLETVERLCDDAAIICDGRLRWQGSLAPFSAGAAIEFEGHSLQTLEALYLKLAGERQVRLSWMAQKV